MPELPEVEVVKKSLEEKIKNLTIKRVFINNNKLRYKINNREFYKIKGYKIISVERRSKYLLINLNQNLTILAHLGMTGKFFIIDNNNTKIKTSFYYSVEKNESKHDHLTLYLNKGLKLIYNDVRKFGFLRLFKNSSVYNCRHLKFLGPEPLTKKFNLSYIIKYFLNRKTSIKKVLMDQKFVSGLGNIYVNEILFLSGVKPMRKVKNLKNAEINKIVSFTKKILREAIKYGGSSIKDFSTISGKEGTFQQHFRVYGRKGEKCSNTDCNKSIIKLSISNRGTFYCSSCQK